MKVGDMPEDTEPTWFEQWTKEVETRIEALEARVAELEGRE